MSHGFFNFDTQEQAEAPVPVTKNSFFVTGGSDYVYTSYQEQLFRDTLDQANRAKTEADRAEAEADRSTTEADRSQTEANLSADSAAAAAGYANDALAQADRAKTEADRAQTISDDFQLSFNFSALTDTPSSFTSFANNFLQVNATEDGIEYTNEIDGGVY